MDNSIKYYSVEDLESMIEPLKKELKMNEGELSVRLGYNEGYLSQVKSRGKIPAKLVQTIRREKLTLLKATFPKEDSEESKMKVIEKLTDTNAKLVNLLIERFAAVDAKQIALGGDQTPGKEEIIPDRLKAKTGA